MPVGISELTLRDPNRYFDHVAAEQIEREAESRSAPTPA